MILDPKIYTVESVTNGHPDKICDQISDAILDEALRQDPNSRVAIESFGAHGTLMVGGEITTNAKIDYEKIAKQVYKKIGYTERLEVITRVVQQSPDIAQGVNTGGAGDQGIMYGFATNETEEYLPLAVVLVHKLTSGLQELRESGKISWLKPDGKAQVTMDGNKISTILISCQHDKSASQQQIREDLVKKLIKPLLKKYPKNVKDDTEIQILVNPTGQFIIGGFAADTGLTGRKIMVDTYGGLIPHGGGCFSGKDPTKVDRSAAYMARFVAKNIVANKLAKKCLVSVAYAIGRAEPVMVTAFDEKGQPISKSILNKFDFRPNAIIETLNLRQPIYQQTAAYGHFGKNNLPWEKIIKISPTST
jgi:S-adenosylmethionine synthetase